MTSTNLFTGGGDVASASFYFYRTQVPPNTPAEGTPFWCRPVCHSLAL